MNRSATLLLALLAATAVAVAIAMRDDPWWVEPEPLAVAPQERDATAASIDGDRAATGPAPTARTAIGRGESVPMTAILQMDVAHGIHVVGRAVDATGAALAGVAVSLRLPAGFGWLGDAAPTPLTLGTTTTDATGRFELRGVDVPGYLLILEHARHPPVIFDLVGPREPGELRDLGSLVLHASLGLVVRVEARESAAPVAGARVLATPVLFDPFLGGAGPRRSAMTDDAGAAVIYGLPAGDWTVRVEADGFATIEVGHHQRPDATVTTALRVALEPGHSLRGRVLGPAGEPVAGARLTLITAGPAQVSTVIQSGAGGEFRAVGLPAGRLTVLAESQRWERVSRGGVSLPTDERLELRFAGGLSLSGRVVDDRDGTPLAAVRVEATRSDREPLVRAGRLVRPSVVTDATGSFRVDGLPPGRFDLEFTSQRHARSVVAALEPTPEPAAGSRVEPTSFRLKPAPEVDFTVRDPSGRPLPDAEVEMLPADHDGTSLKELLLRATGAGKRLATRTDANGRGTLPTAEPAFRLLVRTAQHATHLGPALTVPTGQARFAAPDLTLTRGGTIGGRCTDAAGRPVPDLLLRAEPTGPGPARMFEQTRADADGRYRFGPLAAGAWLVTAPPRGIAGRVPTATVIVIDGESLSHEVQVR